jgi:hypothetical protein
LHQFTERFSMLVANQSICLLFSELFIFHIFRQCVYPAKSKGPNQLPNCLKIAETSVVLNVFKEASSVTSALTLLPFLYVAKQESTYTIYGGHFFFKEPLKDTLMKLVEICSKQVFLLFSRSEIQTGHQAWKHLG